MAISEKRPIHLAFLGCGFATRLHSRTLPRVDKHIRRYYASRSGTKAESYNKKFGGYGAFEGYEAAVRSPDVDAVLIATPPAQHLDLTLLALRAGKHAIVEKPPFLHAADFNMVREVQRETGKQVFVAENYFYKPLARKLRTILKQGSIGEVIFLHMNALKQQTTDNWRDDAAIVGKGALFEGGIHWINLMTNLGLNVEAAYGFLPGAATPLERSALVTIRYKEGAVGALYYSWDTPALFKGLRLSKIYGREGTITFESNGVFVAVHGRKKQLSFPGLTDIAGYQAMFEDFISAIQSESAPQFTLERAQQDLQLVEHIYQSIRQQSR